MDAGHGRDVIDISMRSKQQRVLPSNGAVKFSRRRWGSDLPAIKRVRVTGLTKTFASRKTRIGSSVTEQVCSYLAPADLNDVTHGRLPESLELLIWDLIPVSDFYRTQFSGSDFSRNRRSRHPG